MLVHVVYVVHVVHAVQVQAHLTVLVLPRKENALHPEPIHAIEQREWPHLQEGQLPIQVRDGVMQRGARHHPSELGVE